MLYMYPYSTTQVSKIRGKVSSGRTTTVAQRKPAMEESAARPQAPWLVECGLSGSDEFYRRVDYLGLQESGSSAADLVRARLTPLASRGTHTASEANGSG